MTLPVEPLNQQRNRLFLPLVALGSAIVVFTIATVFFIPLISDNSAKTDAFLTGITKNYGAQEMSSSRWGTLYVRIDGKSISCGQVSNPDLAAHKPIKCSDGTVLQYKNG